MNGLPASCGWVQRRCVEDREQASSGDRMNRHLDDLSRTLLRLHKALLEFVPSHCPVYVWFDVYDLEEKRL
jgi:hypothetical protein